MRAGLAFWAGVVGAAVTVLGLWISRIAGGTSGKRSTCLRRTGFRKSGLAGNSAKGDARDRSQIAVTTPVP